MTFHYGFRPEYIVDDGGDDTIFLIEELEKRKRFQKV